MAASTHRRAPLPTLTLLTTLALTAFATSQEPTPSPSAPPTLTLPAFTGFAHPDPEAIRRRDDGSIERCEGELRFYVHFATTGDLHVELDRGAGPGDKLEMALTSQAHPEIKGPKTVTHLGGLKSGMKVDLGTVGVQAPGYHCLTLRYLDGSTLRNFLSLTLSGPAAENAHAILKERRNAASVHLGYPVPKPAADAVEWFYCEVTPRTDPLWTYYMATGWHRGYFGMQVNSPTERRLIFSVWDSGNEGIDRSKVAADDRVQLIAKGDGVVADSFGNEGTGGHSHLVHDWQLGGTFRFLMRAVPDGDHTTYTGWFWFAERKAWGLIASFRAPKDGKFLHGLYSFNENFSGANGNLQRDCEFGNVWIRTSGGEWLPIREARFTHDETGKRDRQDRCGGARENRFFLQNGGFLAPAAGTMTRGGAKIAAQGEPGPHPTDDELPKAPVRGEMPR